MLKLSELFMKDAYVAFDHHYFENQKVLILHKVEKIFQKLKNYLVKVSYETDSFEIKLIKFLKITNLQFPWSITQAKEAHKTIYDVLSNY